MVVKTKKQNKMATIKLEIKSCKECPFLETKVVYTSDSWERPEDWFCKKSKDAGGLKKIEGYVEWHDKVKIPEWCPIKEK
jgi:hypothetical protein